MCSRRTCVIRCVVWLSAVVLCTKYALAQEIVTASPQLASVCLHGSFDREGKCNCKPGYSEYKGNCFLQSVPDSAPHSGCPTGTILWNGFCHYKSLPPVLDVVAPQEKLLIVPPLRVDIPTPELVDPLDPSYAQEEEVDNDEDGPEGTHDDREVIMPQRPGHNLRLSFQKVFSNHNIINNVTATHTHNVNNVAVHFFRRKANEGIRTVVIRNNEATVYGAREKEYSTPNINGSSHSMDESTTESEGEGTPRTTEAPQQTPPPCCTIVSPRVCRKQADEWVCFHRKQYVCSSDCIADVMYLRPRRPSYRHPWLIMPPRSNPFARFKQCRWGRCPRRDCSGCVRGTFPCHPMCYTYDCMMDNSCHFIDRDMLCRDPSIDVCALVEERTIDLLPRSETNT